MKESKIKKSASGNMKRPVNRDKKLKLIALLAMMVMLLTAVFAVSVISGSADTYYTVRINYYYANGNSAHDPYIATYRAGEPVDLTVTNPNIDGYQPMTAATGGGSAATTTFSIPELTENVTETVYYAAGMTHFRVRYYKQNIYDDLYTADNTLGAEYTDRYGYTGSNPTDLEDINFPGFTNLFHEPDAIAADGSTVFKVYYDRNYYSVMFDLGSAGYGVDPVYAKYQTVYHIGEPKRMGYTFVGWLRTNRDSTKGTYKYASRSNPGRASDSTWYFVDENGDELLDDNGNPLFDENGIPLDPESGAESLYENFTQNTIADHNTYFKAIYESGTTSYSVVYWLENPDGIELTAEMIQDTENIDEARALIAQNYTVVVARDIENVPSGTMVNLNTIIQNAYGEDMELYDLFAYDLTNEEHFPMSDALRAELVGKEKYYHFNEEISMLQFSGVHEDDQTKTHIEVMGDGTTRINVYYDRRDFDLKFFYARRKLNNGVANGQIDLTNSTKNFSNYEYYKKSNETYLNALAKGTWQSNIADSLPEIRSDLLVENGGPLTPGYVDYGGWRYYYYEVSAKYNSNLSDKWHIDAISSVHKKGYSADQICYPGSWAVENGTYFYDSHKSVNNFTVKGIYERLGDELMFKPNTVSNYQELHYLLSWTNTATSSGWNYGTSNVLHFTYENYVELLPREVDLMVHDDNNDGEPDGVQGLIDAGLYVNVYELRNNTFTWIDHSQPFVYHADAVYYGLKEDFVIETTDSGSQYPINDYNKKTASVRSDQVPTELTGFKLINADNKNSNGQIVLDTSNTIVDWSDDTSSYRHALVKFFYNRRTYMLKYRNGNRLDREYSVKYGAPLNSYYRESGNGYEAGDYRYWFDDPQYFNEDLVDYYNFVGWYDTPYYYREVDKDTATMPADDMTLYARWDPKIINVSFYNSYNDYYDDVYNNDGETDYVIGDPVTVDYGSYVPYNKIPADYTPEDPDDPNNRPQLDPVSEGASFAGWYYIDNRVPKRFEPENLPITGVNNEAAHQGKLRLYAEWVTKDVAKYKVEYVEEGTGTAVAPSTIGRAFVSKTKTFDAKSSEELNESHRWSEEAAESGGNWYPTSNSHSILIKNNQDGEEYEPNTWTFYYIQKEKVHYKVQYLDTDGRNPIAEEKTGETADAIIKEDAPFIPGYVAQNATLTLTLSASSASTAAEQEAEELEINVITFLYSRNTTDYLYEVEYYKQDIDANDADDDDYTLYRNESLTVPIVEGSASTVAVADLYDRPIPIQIEDGGFTRAAGATKVVTVNGQGATSTTSVADNGIVTVTGDTKTTIRVYYNRNQYTYSYQYIDYKQDRAYQDTPEADRAGMWDGVIEEHMEQGPEPVESEIVIPTPTNLTYSGTDPATPYTRISDNVITVLIEPITPNNPTVNLVKVYYRKDIERELQYKMVCVNDNSDTDYDQVTGDPLYGGLSSTMQTVEHFNDVNNITFYNYNDAMKTVGGKEEHVHLHRYTFLGWYTTQTYDPDHPEVGRLTTNETLTKADLPNGELPSTDSTYYALVRQDMVKFDIDFVYTDTDITEIEDNKDAELVVRSATEDTDGSITGSCIHFYNPSGYQNHTESPWHRTDGYTLGAEPIDDQIYKYEFAEWWEVEKVLVADGDTIPAGAHTEEDDDGNVYIINYIRKTNWNSSGDWAADYLDKQVTRNKDNYLIAVYTRKPEKTTLNVELHYLFKPRNAAPDDEPKDYVVKRTLEGDTLNASIVDDNGAYAMNNAFIMQNAPYESNYGETLYWSDREIEKDSSETTQTLYATVTALQSTKTVRAMYRVNPAAELQTVEANYGDNYKMCPAMENIVADETYNGLSFKYWAVRKSADLSAPVIAKSYDPLFYLCMMDNYWLTPVYEAASDGPGTKSAVLNPTACANGDEQWLAWTWTNETDGVWLVPDANMRFTGLTDNVIFVRANKTIAASEITWDSIWNQTDNLSMYFEGTDLDGRTFTLSGYNDGKMVGSWSADPAAATEITESESTPTVTLTHLDYTRNRWTDEEGVILNSGETDLLYTDFEIAFEDGDNKIQNSSDYQTGVVYELCAQVPDNFVMDTTRDYVASDYTALAAAVSSHLDGANVTQYQYKAGKARSIQFSDIPTSDLTNMNRVEFAKVYRNTFNASTNKYTNSTYLLKATAYIVKDGTVTFSNSVYMCLKDIASRNTAVPEMIHWAAE